MSTSYDMSLKYGVDFNFTIEGKVVVVTGGLGGIATAANEALLSKGAKIAIFYPDFEKDRVDEAMGRYPSDRVRAWCCDVTKEDQVDACIDEVIQHFGTIDVLVNAAGTITLTPAEEISLIEWQRQVDVNFTAPFLCSKAVGRHMLTRGKGGKIINIASQAATVAIDQHCAYTSAKAGLLGMTKSLAKEWGPRGINVNSISPTVVLTPMGAAAWEGEKGERMKSMIPMGRFAYTDEIAASILFLASNGSDMINGADLMIDGGYTIW
ncbi:GolD/DthD family dehydrogenase [Halomonas salipaludis]|uniref:D-threitol dehydrogenase n=1 Tax=Halomonas salipaludis TaxID=2032625 RepID=A0A2A2F195_9GAMM|nr:D-threitol dehydrogenase [Halomonas salipaludis]PAU78504.1 D-threitol dehydrogenase [Halomonas salipaludis]